MHHSLTRSAARPVSKTLRRSTTHLYSPDPLSLRAILNSLVLAAGAAILATVIGLGIGVLEYASRIARW